MSEEFFLSDDVITHHASINAKNYWGHGDADRARGFKDGGNWLFQQMELSSELDRRRKYHPIDRELTRAENLHPNYPSSIFQQLAIMQEEAGEVTKAVLDYSEGKAALHDVREELTQTAAMCVRMLKNLPEKEMTYKELNPNIANLV